MLLEYVEYIIFSTNLTYLVLVSLH